MATRFVRLLADCASRRVSGSKRHLTSLLPTGNIIADNPLLGFAMKFDAAEKVLLKAEAKVRAQLAGSIKQQPDFGSVSAQDVNKEKAQNVSDACVAIRMTLRSKRVEVRVAAVRACRELVSTEMSKEAAVDVIDNVISAGILQDLVCALTDTDDVELQLEAACTLTVIAAGGPLQQQAVVSNGAVPYFTLLSQSQHPELREQAKFALQSIKTRSPSPPSPSEGRRQFQPVEHASAIAPQRG